MKRFFVFCPIFFLLMIFLWSSESSASLVSEVEIHGLSSLDKEELLYLLDIRPGERIDADTVRTGIKRAFLKGIFEDISVEAGDGEETKVVIHVKEKDSVRKISIEGDYAVSRKKIKDLFHIKEGMLLTCGLLEKASEDLKRNLEFLGFPRVEIHTKIKRLKKTPYLVDILIGINTGEPERIKKIEIEGAAEEAKSVMKLTDGDVYNREILKQDIEKIRAYLKKKGYYKPVISRYTFKDGVLAFSVNPGKRLQISVHGNDTVSTKDLMKEIPFFEAEDFSDDIVQEAVNRLLSIYHVKGYPFAQVAPVVTVEAELITAAFFIFEGTKVDVNEISFHGNSLKEDRLKEIMSLRKKKKYNPDLLDSDREALENFYNALGYLSVKIDDIQAVYEEGRDSVNIIVGIHEGAKTEIGSVDITGANLVSETELWKVVNLHPGDPYNEVDLSDARYRIIEFYSKKGFPNVAVEVKRAIEERKAGVTFQIKEGSVVLFGKAIVTGNRKTKYEVVRRELKQQENMPFDYTLLSKERQQLYKSGLFTAIDMEALDAYEDKKDVLIKLREGNAGAVELSLGYAEYELYRGILDLSYRNVMGMNRQTSLRLEVSSLERRYVLQYYEPWFLSTELPFRILILGEDRKEINIDTRETRYRLTRNSITAGFEKKMSDILRGELFYEFSLVNTFQVKPDVVLSKEDTGTLVISGLRLGLIYDTRDNQFYPKKGIFSGASLKITSPVFLSESNFIKLTLYGNVYHEVAKGFVLAASLRGGLAQGYVKTSDLPIVERFFLGGRTTVRGYNQDTLGPLGADGNPIGGNVFLMENLELRTSLGKNFGLVTFLDGGNVWLNTSDVKLGDVKFTAGLGLRYNTPVGPIRIDYGQKLQKEKGESAGELHFSIGHAF
ncbi:MAG: outer membrane protein assembly factor BamA [Thermodesulfovibrionales bacterium]